MRLVATILTAVSLSASCVVASAQTTTAPPGQGAACPPGTGPNPPAVGQDSNRSLSDQLAQSKGVICPPAGVDPEMHQAPPQGGAMKVIPPPGSPGGNPGVQPK